MIIYILMATALLLSLLLIVDKKSNKLDGKRDKRQDSVGYIKTDLLENDLLTELMEANPQKFDLKGVVLNGMYEVESLLGEGGMGKVYLCRNIKLGNLWAVKFIPKSNEGRLNRRLAEEEILKKLNHIHLPQIVDIFKDEKGTYIVESFIAGTPLDKKFQKERFFKEDEVLRWFMQLTDVLIYLHGMKPHPIIYGDMKPSNVMITPDNRAVLIDFSVSREIRKDPNTNPAPMGITAKFAAPEQFLGLVDTRSDLYSLGVMIFYLLSGDFPQKELNIKELKGSVSKKMRRVLERCLQKDINLRYPSAQELKRDLDGLNKDNKGLLAAFSSKTRYQAPLDYKKIIVLISPESTGKTTIATNLAWKLAERNIKTILIDTDSINKDVYYHFDKDFSNCLGNLKEGQVPPAVEINQYLSIYTDHRDVSITIEAQGVKDLILKSKGEAQVVIVDVGRTLQDSTIREILSLADHKILVVDQRINLLNRIPQQLHVNLGWLKEVDLVINRYLDSGFMKEKSIKSFFKGIEGEEENFFDIKINRVFMVREDYSAILKGLEERTPSVAFSPLMKEDMENLSQYYYRL